MARRPNRRVQAAAAAALVAVLVSILLTSGGGGPSSKFRQARLFGLSESGSLKCLNRHNPRCWPQPPPPPAPPPPPPPAPPPPPPPAPPPSGLSVRHFWLGIANADAFSYSVQDSGRMDALIAHTYLSWSAQGAPYEAANPAGRALFYVDFGVAGDGGNTVLGESAARSAGLLAHHSGAEILNPWGGTSKVVDLGAPGACAAYVAALRTKLAAAPWRGLLADDANAWYDLWQRGLALDGYSSPQDYWTRAALPLFQCVSGQLQTFIAPNVGAWTSYPYLGGVAAYTGGAMNEYFLTWGDGSSEPPAAIEAELGQIRQLAAAGRTYLGVLHRDDAQGLRYGFCAAAILGGDDPAHLLVAEQVAYGSSPLAWDPLLDANLGAPSSAIQHQPGSVAWSRSFSGGQTLSIDTAAQTCATS